MQQYSDLWIVMLRYGGLVVILLSCIALVAILIAGLDHWYWTRRVDKTLGLPLVKTFAAFVWGAAMVLYSF